MSITTRSIAITNIVCNIENPRFELVGNQKEAIDVMIENQGTKLLNLAKDIVSTGMLNPGKLLLVAPHPTEAKRYYTLEGNRRITILKLLAMPSLMGTKHAAFARRLKPYAEKFSHNPITHVSCVIFSNPEEANRWVKLEHTGENEGIGTVSWDYQQVGRFEERVEGNSPIALQALDFLKGDDTVSDELKAKLKDVPSTNLDRLLRDKSVQAVIGISVKDNRLQTHLKREEVTKGLTKIVNDLASKKIKVKDIYTKEDREKYIETFLPDDIPNKRKRADASWELISVGPPVPAVKVEPSKKSNPLSTDRETLIPKDCILNIKEARLNKIYRELKTLKVESYENAAGVLFRVFIELAIDSFIEKHSVPEIKDNATLATKVIYTSTYMENNGMVLKNAHKGLRSAVNNRHNILSMETFNAYVHNRLLSPEAINLKVTWDNIQIFVEKIFENI